MDKLYQLLEDDYQLAVGAFENMQLLYMHRFENNNYTPSQKANFLMNLGVVGEKLLKYIYGIYLIELNNQQILSKTSQEFDELFRVSNKRIREVASILKLDLNSSEIQSLLDYQDENNQKAHNIDFYYKLINTFKPSYLDDLFKKYFEWKIISDISRFYEVTEEYKNFEYKNNISIIHLFPDEIENNVYDDTIKDVEKEALVDIIKLKEFSLKKGGDSFTRFRYAINNGDNRNIDLNNFYDSINDILNIANMVHNNKSLNFDIDYEFFKYSFLHNASKLGYADDEAKYILNLNLKYDVYKYGIYDAYSFKQIKEIIDYGFTKDDIEIIFLSGLKLRTILSYYKKGIYDLNFIVLEENEKEEEIAKECKDDAWFDEQEEKRQKWF